MSRALGLAAAAATGVQVGAALVMSRAALPEIGPLTLAALRYGIGVLVLLPVLALLRPGALQRGDIAPVAALGVVQFGLLVALLNWSLTRIGAAEAGLLFATFPVMTVLLAAALGRERLSAGRLAGALLTFLGVAVTLGSLPRGGEVLGAGAVLLAAFCGAAAAIGTRPYLQRNPTLTVGVVAMAAAGLALALMLPLEGMPGPVSLRTLWLILGVGLLSGAGYVIWLTALKFAEAGEATVLLNISPLAAAGLSMLFLGETPSLALLPGAALALAGVTLTLRAPVSVQPPAPPPIR